MPHSPAPPVASPGLSPDSQTSSSRYKSYDANRNAKLVKALGWFSIGLGAAQLLAPRRMSRMVGTAEDHPTLMRAVGAREIAAGVGLLSQRKATPWLWARVAGDAMDLAMLGMASRRTANGARRRMSLATAAVAGITVLDLLSSLQNSKVSNAGTSESETGALRVEKTITVNRSADECYRFWRDFENFPRFMKHLDSVQRKEGNRWHWKAKGPAGMHVEWDAEITTDQPGQMLSWRSVEGADVDNIGSVRFERAPGGHGTIVRVDMEYNPPGGKAGAMVAKLFGEEPTLQIDQALRRFKWLIETGEIPTTIGQPSGPRDMMSRVLLRKGEPG